ncbi:MAG TPA: hypothetical protein VLH40_07990 [Atribacteraceae bacterium]|nr:hypothetical protein [Atribacteraceae bacterium]
MFWVFHLALNLGFGSLIGFRVFSSRTLLFRLSAGILFGMLGAMWSPVPSAFYFGFTPVAHYLGWGIMGLIALLIVMLYKDKGHNSSNDDPPESFHRWEIVGILVFALFIGYLFTSHFFLDSEGAVFTRGNLYGDLPFHLGMITSLVEQEFFPPEYTFFPGARLGYPFLTNLLSASLHQFGLSLRWSVILPSFFFVFLLVFWFFQFARLVLKGHFTVLLAALMFFVNGGLGAFYALDNAWIDPERFSGLFQGSAHSPTNWTEHNIVWSNVICDLILPQRTTLAGWAVLFFALYLLYRALTLRQRKDYVLAGLVGGLMPIIHTHSFLAFSLISLTWFIGSFFGEREKSRQFIRWLLFGIPFLLLALPQLWEWTFSQAIAGGFFRFHLGWANRGDIWPWFWLKNVGIVFLLIFPALLSRDRIMNRFYLPAVIIFILGELFAFQPWVWDNIKLFFIWYLFSVFLVSNYLYRLNDRLQGFPSRSVILVIVVFFAVFSGVLSLVRETLLPPHQLFSKNQVAQAEFSKDSTLPDGLFLSAGYHNNAVMALAGRSIFMGFDGWLWSHGIDYGKRQALVEEMFTQTERFAELAQESEIDYLMVGPRERHQFETDWNFFMERYPLIYRGQNQLIFAVSPRAQEKLNTAED